MRNIFSKKSIWAHIFLFLLGFLETERKEEARRKQGKKPQQRTNCAKIT
jgi:hypothetical protein